VVKSDLWGPIARYTIATARSYIGGDIDALALCAGKGVGFVRRTQSAADIVKEIVEEARQAIEIAGREN
jgi:hypothetical protein